MSLSFWLFNFVACGGDASTEPPEPDSDTAPLEDCDAAELCDGLDQDCDGEIDEGAPPAATSGYADPDGDGYGTGEPVCGGTAPVAGDCDTEDPATFPGADDPCDEVDQDCDGLAPSCGPEGSILLADLPSRLVGGEGAYGMGSVLASPGDVDEDGFADVWVTQPATGSGRVHLIRGPVTGEIDADDAIATITGWGCDDGIASAGDLDGDGASDLLLMCDGVVYTFSSRRFGAWDTDAALAVLVGSSENAVFDADMAGGGDLTGDGYPTTVVQARARAGGAQKIVGISLLSGQPSPYSVDEGAFEIPETDTNPNDAYALRADTDFDGDGAADLLLGGADTVWLLPGPLAGEVSLDDAALSVTGGGASIGAGDLDDDGLPDVLVTERNGGVVYALSPTLAGPRSISDAFAAFEGDSSWPLSGELCTGDLNADGVADLVVGTPSAEVDGDQAGGALVWHGRALGTRTAADADATLIGEGEAVAGRAVACPGDMDGDGAGDIAVGGPYWGEPTTGSLTQGIVWFVQGGSL